MQMGVFRLENMLMLPFEGRTLVFSYVAALGAYTLLTKTAGLLAVVWAVSEWSWAEILGSVLTAFWPLLQSSFSSCRASRMLAALISLPAKLRRICPSSSTNTRSEVWVMLSRMWEENRTVPYSLYPAIS